MPLIFPTLMGLGFNVVKRPKGSVEKQASVSGFETRIGYWSYPMYEWDLTFDFLRDFQRCPTGPQSIISELKLLMGFYVAMSGSLTAFYYDDPDDNTMVGQPLGTADGIATDFPVMQTYGDPSYGVTVTQPVGGINGVTVYLNGIMQPGTGAYTIVGDPSAFYIRFPAPLAPGIVVTADVNSYFLVRFKEDSADFEKFSGGPPTSLIPGGIPTSGGFWALKKVTLMSLRSE
jgi:uncharacterized protein (TIGR02217 family)